jgi:N-methylhydantoinase B/oxoprolinase/acetone carboxylase alpha subunit
MKALCFLVFCGAAEGRYQAGDGLEAQFQFGEQRRLGIVAEGFEPAARLGPGGRIVGGVVG